MDLFVVLLKSGAMFSASRYVLEEDGYYYFDGQDREYMTNVSDITPVYVVIDRQNIAGLTLLTAISFDYKGTRYLVTGSGNYVRQRDIFVKLKPNQGSREMRLLLNGIFFRVAADFD